MAGRRDESIQINSSIEDFDSYFTNSVNAKQVPPPRTSATTRRSKDAASDVWNSIYHNKALITSLDCDLAAECTADFVHSVVVH